jgi:hypothetical protein
VCKNQSLSIHCLPGDHDHFAGQGKGDANGLPARTSARDEDTVGNFFSAEAEVRNVTPLVEIYFAEPGKKVTDTGILLAAVPSKVGIGPFFVKIMATPISLTDLIENSPDLFLGP